MIDDACRSGYPDRGDDRMVDATPRKRESLRGVLLAILLALVLLTLHLLRGDPLVAARLDALLAPRFQRVARPVDVAGLMRDDPEPGFVLRADRASRPVYKAARGMRSPRMLVWVGDCADCLAADLPLWEREARRTGAQMVLLTSASSHEAAKFRTRKGIRTVTASDPGGVLAKRLHATWAGRPYLFSSDWRLLWLDRQYPGLRNPFADAQVDRLLADERRVQ